MEIRHAEAGDVVRIVGLNRALFREDSGRRDPFMDQGWPEREGGDYFASLVAGKRSVCLLAESDAGVVGYLAAYVRQETTLRPIAVAELESMYVVEDHRNQGVGTRMVDEFLAWAAAEGAELALVTAYAANGRAVRFYQRSGFGPKSISLERSLG